MSILFDLLKKIPELNANTAHIDLLKTSIENLEKENNNLKEENNRLKTDLIKCLSEKETLRKQLEECLEKKNFKEHLGLFWKSGESKPYCPKCMLVMYINEWPPGKEQYWKCSICKFQTEKCQPPSI